MKREAAIDPESAFRNKHYSLDAVDTKFNGCQSKFGASVLRFGEASAHHTLESQKAPSITYSFLDPTSVYKISEVKQFSLCIYIFV